MKTRLIIYIILFSNLWVFSYDSLNSQTTVKPNSAITLYQESSHLKDSCIIVLLGILDTLDPSNYKNLIIYHKMVEMLSSEISNENVANFYLRKMSIMVPSPIEWTDDIWKDYPYLKVLLEHSTWGVMKPLINFLSTSRTEEELRISMSIIETITKRKISDPILNTIQFYGNNEVAKNVETMRIMLNK